MLWVFMRFFSKWFFVAGLLAVTACSSVAPLANQDAAGQSPPFVSTWTQPANASAESPGTAAKAPTWLHYTFPGKQATQYTLAHKDGRSVMEATAESSASLVRQSVHISPDQLHNIRFSWKVPDLIPGADLASRDLADSPVRIVLAFEGDRGRFSAKNAMLSELSRVITGEPMPYAILMYVWCNTRAPGSVIMNPRTDRIREFVVESGAKNLNQWLDYDRNIRADFEKAFGEAPGALVGIGIMTDTDNTRTTTHAWYGQVRLAGR